MNEEVFARLESVVGPGVQIHGLKSKPGRRSTFRAVGHWRTAIAKQYASDRVGLVAARVQSLQSGPPEPVVPEVLLVDPELHLVILSEVSGTPLREPILAGNLSECRRAGLALGTWHAFWQDRQPDALAAHTAQRELEILHRTVARAPEALATVVRMEAQTLLTPWRCSTVVHRDLYEEQVLVGQQIGLIDLDDAAIGPPELDLGNFIAHIELLELQQERELTSVIQIFLDGYNDSARPPDYHLLDRCRRLTLLRLACIHGLPELLERIRIPHLQLHARGHR